MAYLSAIVRYPKPTSSNHLPADGSVILSWSPGIEIYSAKDLGSQKLATPATIPFAQLAAEYYVNLIKPSEEPRDQFIKTAYISPNNAALCEDEIRITSLLLDLDVDSDNDGTVEPDAADEDSIENVAPEQNPGKVMAINEHDHDGDGLIDYADWEITGADFNENLFAEVRLRLPETIAPNNVRIYISYEASDPAGLNGENLPMGDSLRLWKKPSNQLRNPARLQQGGDFIPSSIIGKQIPLTPRLNCLAKMNISFWRRSIPPSDELP